MRRCNLQEPPSELAGNDLRIWNIALDGVASEGEWELLDVCERRRANTFRSLKDRSRFIVAHAALREILSAQLGVPASSLVFGSNAYGKPFLVQPVPRAGLQFNLAHSQDVAVVAVSRKQEVGVDVERVGVVPDAAAIAERYFHWREAEWLRQMPLGTRAEAFFELWTMKEACVKAAGFGLAQSLNSFCVVGPDTTTPFTAAPLTSPTGYKGAVACRSGE
jgi:4'-phosphopantetheinyl transferase